MPALKLAVRFFSWNDEGREVYMHIRVTLLLFRFCFSIILVCSMAMVSMADNALPLELVDSIRKNVLVIGKISNNPKKHYTYLKPIADYVVSHMNDLGITESKVIFAKNTEQMVTYIKKGKVDWITETPFTAVIFQEEAGAQMLLRRWKRGVPEYHTVFITRRDSDIRSINDLIGKTIAFESPESTSAFFIPLYVLLEKGINPVKLDSPFDKPPKGRVGYVFSGQEINMSIWLHKRMVDVSAYSNLDWDKKDHTPLELRKDFIIFHHTKPVPRVIELVRNNLDPAVKFRLKEVLMKAHLDLKAKPVLKKYQKTTKFDELNSQALDSIDRIRSILKFIQMEISK
ncbi:MAG: phosphate/phosphite/phosphonate ABC transporter substrate-binding protein [Desulfobacula sp.]|uniref:phosphate/phosphite/phosphonate ABC transporter substrate-binding protein n=1 Tax=Desulfobacula sp. TaxID=2593537 RepID=UPI0025B9DA2E|nr:phosphate/phosphite/phosphonate ABC transporter substrate-binding protein [Desulfobacula sp.]MCD4718737.1 phosphate/phosphite/phosphonate ABC transporter substrate-binding protein [Desulfobacula sp.]